MWKQIRSWIGGEPAKKPADDFDSIKSNVERVLKLDLASDAARETHADTVIGMLKCLDAAVEDIRQKADGYPAKPISGAVWMNGAGYANLAFALTEHFKGAGWLEREENASMLWAKATLAVCSHYHHLVGPAMLANADCQDRLGNAEQATQMYSGVVKDFAFLVDGFEEDGESPDDDSRIALESLRTATERLLDREMQNLDDIDLPSLKSRVDSILTRPKAS